MKKNKEFSISLGSAVVHGSSGGDAYTGAVSFPIYQTATFRHSGLGEGGYSYTRSQNPTREELEKTIAMLEGGKCGFAFSTGLAAVTAVFSLLKSQDHVIISDDLYGGTYRQIETVWKSFGVKFTYVDTSDAENIISAIRPNTRMIFFETPTNPMMKVSDIERIASIAKEAGLITVVDNTFLTPYFQRPLELGADIVIHSGTKYLAGHNDTMCGLAAAKDDELGDRLRHIVSTEGTCISPLDAWLTLRGIKTLAVRMERHQSNAIKIARFLKKHPDVENVYYAGLPESAGYEVSCRQASGFGGMISFTVREASVVNGLLKNLRMIRFAESLGGVETLITYPVTQTHASIPEEIRNRIGITDRLLRLSVGIEEPSDIIADLRYALNKTIPLSRRVLPGQSLA
ncbi:MAG: trans-sulfuration enzyme family protein [Oscillospiraceae bacterium]|jgi:cystathionine gamma-synthase